MSEFKGNTPYYDNVSQNNEYNYTNPLLSEYKDIIKGMQNGVIDWTDDKTLDLYQKSPDFVNTVMNTYKTQEEYLRDIKLEEERNIQEQNKKKVEAEKQAKNEEYSNTPTARDGNKPPFKGSACTKGNNV